MTEDDLSRQPSTDHQPATEAPVVAGAGLTFDALDSTTPLTADPDGSGQHADPDQDEDEDEDGAASATPAVDE